jgi:hypothetical protein
VGLETSPVKTEVLVDGKVDERVLAGSGDISQIRTRHPSWTNFLTMPAPNPDPPPVTMATLPTRRSPGIVVILEKGVIVKDETDNEKSTEMGETKAIKLETVDWDMKYVIEGVEIDAILRVALQSYEEKLCS